MGISVTINLNRGFCCGVGAGPEHQGDGGADRQGPVLQRDAP